MAKEEYEYRGIYDSGEVGRIEALLAEQRAMFNSSDEKQFDLKESFKKYGVIILGATVLLLTLKFVNYPPTPKAMIGLLRTTYENN